MNSGILDTSFMDDPLVWNHKAATYCQILSHWQDLQECIHSNYRISGSEASSTHYFAGIDLPKPIVSIPVFHPHMEQPFLAQVGSPVKSQMENLKKH